MQAVNAQEEMLEELTMRNSIETELDKPNTKNKSELYHYIGYILYFAYFTNFAESWTIQSNLVRIRTVALLYRWTATIKKREELKYSRK